VTNAYDRAGLLEVVTNDHKAVTAILLAALGSHLDIVKFLYESGANLHAKNSRCLFFFVQFFFIKLVVK
jgi:hypothetical protein